MILVDAALGRRHDDRDPVKVAMVGAGFMGRAVALQLATAVPGMELVAIASRTVGSAERAYLGAGVDMVSPVESVAHVERVVASGGRAVTDDPAILCRAGGIDAILDVTGDLEEGAQVALDAIENGKHVVMMNAGLGATIGPILKRYADGAGVVLTDTDGDEPAVAMNLFRFVRSIGCRPVLAGNLKGFLDRYRTPETQAAFAAATGQRADMVTSYADGTKLAMEATLLANATGLTVGQRGMYGYKCEHVKDVVARFSPEDLVRRPIVDYVLGAQPGTGAFVVGYDEHPVKAQYMRYFKMGEGPLYVFYQPWHLPHLEVPTTIARAVLFHDPAVTPLSGPRCDVVTLAKRDLRAGDVLDGVGGFTSYGVIEAYAVSRAEDLLPIGLSHGCRLRHDIPKDAALRYGDVDVPRGGLVDKLRSEQDSVFGPGWSAGE